MTGTKPTAVEALSAVMEDVQAVAKLDRNDQQHFSFRGVDAVVNAVGPALRKHGVVVVPTAVTATHESYQSRGGALMRNTTLKIAWRFYGPAGDHVDAETLGEASDAGDKSVPKAHSVAYRTLLLQALCIPTDEPDPDASSYERAQPAEPQRSAEDIAALAERTAVARQIQVAGHALGIDGKDALAADFLTRYGLVLHEASTDDLRMFLADLQAEHAATGSDAQGAPA